MTEASKKRIPEEDNLSPGNQPAVAGRIIKDFPISLFQSQLLLYTNNTP
jgi:hypothetical protein